MEILEERTLTPTWVKSVKQRMKQDGDLLENPESAVRTRIF